MNAIVPAGTGVRLAAAVGIGGRLAAAVGPEDGVALGTLATAVGVGAGAAWHAAASNATTINARSLALRCPGTMACTPLRVDDVPADVLDMGRPIGVLFHPRALPRVSPRAALRRGRPAEPDIARLLVGDLIENRPVPVHRPKIAIAAAVAPLEQEAGAVG